MRKITTNELFDLLRHETDGKFFSVTFQRRTTRFNRTQVAGEERTMLCRTGMKSYKLGIVSDEARDEEDLRVGVLTVWSMDAYMSHRRHGLTHEAAALDAWRRVDLMGLRACSLVNDRELPPTYRPELHEVRNLWRRRHMPRVSQARIAR